MRSANENDRATSSTTHGQMKVTREGEDVMNLLTHVIAARGLKTSPFSRLPNTNSPCCPNSRDRAREHGAHREVHGITSSTPRPTRRFRGGTIRPTTRFFFGRTHARTGKIQFHDYAIVYGPLDLPNVQVFKEQIKLFKDFLLQARRMKCR